MKREFRQVDVFSGSPCAGNPVAVVLDAEDLDEDTMRRFSVWSNLSECTFVLPPTSSAADYRVRIFSLNTEFAFAGHPTLGTARAWIDAGGAPRDGGVVVQECGVGLVPIRVSGAMLAFRSPPRTHSGPVDAETLLAVIGILGVDSSHVVDAEWLDNGPGWVGVLLDSADRVLALRPDASRYPGRWDIGAVGPHPEGSETSLEIRAFFTEGVEPLREDPVTGSLNGAVAEWLIGKGRLTAPYVARQGTVIGRDGRVFIDADDAGVWVGGHTRVIVSGSVLF